MAHFDKNLPTSELLSELLSVKSFEEAALLPIFRCVKCGKFLLPPIQLVAGLGNVCGNCNLLDLPITVLYNEALEIIIQNLRIPCPNKSKGCSSICNYYEVLSHLEKCPSRDLQCLFSESKNCRWKGRLEFIFDHCWVEHPELILETKNNSFTLNINIRATNTMLKLLKIYDYQFILHIKCDQQTSSLFYQIGCTSNIDDLENFSITINHEGNNGISLPYEFKKIIPDANFSLNINEKYALRIDLSCFEQFHSELVEAVINIAQKNNTEDINESILSVLECPICINYMKPPIFQCLRGHSVCCNCRDKLQQCPTCHLGFGNTRNYSLEITFSKLKFPCQYKDLGCQTITIGSELLKHELQCKMKPCPCLFVDNGCSWQGRYAHIGNHLKQQHDDKIALSNCVKIAVTRENSTVTNCLIYNGIVFRIYHEIDEKMNTVSWNVQFVASKNNQKQFQFTVILMDTKNEHNKLMGTGLCQELSKNWIQNSTAFPLNITSSYGSQCYCKISQINPKLL